MVRAHGLEEFPREACGLIVSQTNIRENTVHHSYLRCRNIGDEQGQFLMHPEDFVRAEMQGEIAALVHTHPNMPPLPSQADRAACRVSNLPWLIVGVPSFEERWLKPDECTAEVPYLEREYAFGAQDCWTLVHDWYRRELGVFIKYPRYSHEWEFWKRGIDFFRRETFTAHDFNEVKDLHALRCHDIIVFKFRSTIPNHVAVYVGNSQILHHPRDTLSRHDPYDDRHRVFTEFIMRHKVNA